jgi:purine nucleosidase
MENSPTTQVPHHEDRQSVATRRAAGTSRKALIFLAVVAAVASLFVAALGSTCSAGLRAAPAVGTARPPSVVVDTDMDFDDAAALAYLVEAHRTGLIDLRAVTVAIDGVGLPDRALAHARCLLDKLGMPGVATAAGDSMRPNTFPDPIRTLLDGVVERAVQPNSTTACPATPRDGGAANTLISTLRSADRPVTVVVLGPLTDIAEALQRDPEIQADIDRVIEVGGDTTNKPPVNPLDAHSFNFRVDAPAAQAVMQSLPGRVFMSARNASDDVPLTAQFRQQLTNDHGTAAASVVSSIVSDPVITAGEQGQQGGTYWWGPLGAVAATIGGVEQFTTTRLTILQESGHPVEAPPCPASLLVMAVTEGDTVLDPNGTPVHLGVSASPDRFHQVFLDTLNDRRPSLERLTL